MGQPLTEELQRRVREAIAREGAKRFAARAGLCVSSVMQAGAGGGLHRSTIILLEAAVAESNEGAS